MAMLKIKCTIPLIVCEASSLPVIWIMCVNKVIQVILVFRVFRVIWVIWVIWIASIGHFGLVFYSFEKPCNI